MSGWLMAPERLPSYFARDCEPVLQRRPAGSRLDGAGSPAARSARVAARLVKRVADAIEQQSKGSVSAW